MPRTARGDVPAGIYHVTTRSAGPIWMFRDDFDRTFFCNRLAHVIHVQSWTCHAFCLMPTHYHLLLSVGDNMLQPGMQKLNGPYAQQFNARHRRWGHLKGDRYHPEPVLDDIHFLNAFRYIARNPVKDRLCALPSDWLWSSYRGTARIDDGFDFVDPFLVRSYFGGDLSGQYETMRDFVGDHVTEPLAGSVPGWSR